MADIEFHDRLFEKQDISEELIPGISFDSCTFRDCNLTGFNLSGIEFSECLFENCNFSNLILGDTGLKEACFKNCKLTGTDFSGCRDILFEVSFEDCIMDFCIFFRNNLRKTIFSGCKIHEGGFSECDLREAVFKDCDLLRTIFIQNDLAGADFRTTLNYTIDPESNRIKDAKFSYPGILGLLDSYHIIIE
ncbi:MAG: pentapeptide repeat-containing protein [Methanomicrobiaceae archaeon]|nr:pentapeptide repeat-containing protein [Methanomicrobiaceae archaeon]